MRIIITKILLFLLCLPSGGILLLKMYGVIQMHQSTYILFLPSLLLLIFTAGFLWYKKDGLLHVLLLGFLGGLVGTIGYDLIRIPFMLMGSRIFAPISMYGMWLTDATVSTSFSDLIGWLYHFSNGITFGIMYALFMKGRNMWWAVFYALLLETIFVISPFGKLFGLTGKPMALIAAYLGHVAYGYPLGKMVQNHQVSMETINFFRKGLLWFFSITLITTIVLWSISSKEINADPNFTLKNKKISPGIIRVDRGSMLYFQNQTSSEVTFLLPLLNEEIPVEPDGKSSRLLESFGIFHVLIQEDSAIKGVFILCEPVEQYK
ncbi:hypothetical protein GTQ34_14405 [Muricauda sp. JGD-17]|uniref:Uncharacterized protein n=1 Tax=Flagellimonas ochracea TaxID=2696472 RepID=A0A964TE16_9FLAO|nr:hypothetical protein [Allomuricauda ochracea]NAY93107.1 hypothetical protein [Allomuricauda ochracea]